jgi:SMI1 / KNR4 family (SUKH-1)
MSMWKERLERAIAGFEDREELSSEYRFGSPASDSDIAALELHLGRALPSSLRELFGEFNGVAYRDNAWGSAWRPLYLSMSEIVGELRAYFAESGNPLPEEHEFQSVVFFAHQNGFGVLFAVCAEAFGEFSVGQVLAVESDVGEFYVECESLEDFVSQPSYCTL